MILKFFKNIVLTCSSQHLHQDIRIFWAELEEALAKISASGSNVYVTWWTNKTGTLMPVFRTSNDNGDTFAKAKPLNSTG